MKKINNPKLRQKYIDKYDMTQHFTGEVTSLFNLYFWKKGEHICYEDEPMDYLFFFVEGKAKIYITLKNGKSLLLCFYEDFKLIGDLEVMNNKNATANVQIVEDSYCIGIHKDVVKKELLHDVKFLRFICESLSLELERSSKNSSINLLYPLENRLASYLFATIEHSTEEVPIFNENLTALSELLGASYRQLHRSINALCDKNILRRGKTGFEILDIKRLEKMTADLYQ